MTTETSQDTSHAVWSAHDPPRRARACGNDPKLCCPKKAPSCEEETRVYLSDREPARCVNVGWLAAVRRERRVICHAQQEMADEPRPPLSVAVVAAEDERVEVGRLVRVPAVKGRVGEEAREVRGV